MNIPISKKYNQFVYLIRYQQLQPVNSPKMFQISNFTAQNRHFTTATIYISQGIGETVYKGDFRREFGHIDGAVAVDLDKRFAGWKLGIGESVSIKKAEV